MLPLQGAWVQSLVGELRSHILHGAGKKNSNKNFLKINKEFKYKALQFVLEAPGDYLPTRLLPACLPTCLLEEPQRAPLRTEKEAWCVQGNLKTNHTNVCTKQ